MADKKGKVQIRWSGKLLSVYGLDNGRKVRCSAAFAAAFCSFRQQGLINLSVLLRVEDAGGLREEGPEG
jgi:hypothetical protein